VSLDEAAALADRHGVLVHLEPVDGDAVGPSST
jgi:hypothetical protein